jgi:hypothetical protein
VSGEDNRNDSNRWQRRQRRRQAERERQKKHGATIKRVYRDAILKRLKARKKPR